MTSKSAPEGRRVGRPPAAIKGRVLYVPGRFLAQVEAILAQREAAKAAKRPAVAPKPRGYECPQCARQVPDAKYRGRRHAPSCSRFDRTAE